MRKSDFFCKKVWRLKYFSYLCNPKRKGNIIGVWRSWLAHLVWDQRVLCSSHSTPTKSKATTQSSGCFFYYLCGSKDDVMIQAKGIEKSFGALKVLKGIDFSAEKSEVVSIMGASGAGKSTLLQILGSLSSPDAGTLVIDGVDVASLRGKALADFRNRKVGFVFQFHHLLPEFTALENVMIPALIAKRSRKEAQAEAESLLADMGLAERLGHKPSELSGGEQQRVAIARALINNPAVLFADEPSGNLDSKTKEEIHNLFFQLREKYGQTIVIVTHDPDLAKMCDRSLYMIDGQFVEQ